MRLFVRRVLRRELAIVLVVAILLGFVPEIHVHTDEDGHRHVEVELADSPLVIKAQAAEGDPLQGVATVTTGGSASTYVDIDSTYTPSGYTTLTTGSGAYVSDPKNYYSYHTSRNGSTSNE